MSSVSGETDRLKYDCCVTDQPLEPEESVPRPEPQPQPQPQPETEAETERTIPPAGAPRRLRRSRDDSVIAGVCGGLGEYLGVDPVLIRIAAIILVFAGGAGALLYVIGWIAIPEEADDDAVGTPSTETTPEAASGAVVLGFVFVALGAFFLVDELWPDFLSWRYVWPIGLIAVGAAILFRGRT